MSANHVIAKTWQQNILFSALIELTYRCNLDCFFCYNDLALKGKALSDEQYGVLFDDLARLQVMNLTFTGGEPLAHPSFVRLGRMARDLGFVVRIKSNGHALRGKLAEEIREEVDPFLVEVSLHGATADTHDRQTRVPGSFDRLMSNVPELLAMGYRIKFNGTLTRFNEHQIEGMFDVADSLGVLLSLSPTVTPRDDGDTSPLSISPSKKAIKDLYAYLDRRIPDGPSGGTCTGESGAPGPSGKKNCGAGAAGLAVDPFGNVYPCVQWRRPLGNLHDQPIEEIWQSSPALAEIRRVNHEARARIEQLGPEAEGMSHCMGISEEKTGDPLALDPQATEQARLLREVRSERTLLPVIS
ncbi:MAG: radical SAM protein [Acidobacteriota bacterium]